MIRSKATRSSAVAYQAVTIYHFHLLRKYLGIQENRFHYIHIFYRLVRYGYVQVPSIGPSILPPASHREVLYDFPIMQADHRLQGAKKVDEQYVEHHQIIELAIFREKVASNGRKPTSCAYTRKHYLGGYVKENSMFCP